MKFLVPSAAIVSILITSCATTESFVNDDVYSVKPSELPIGESTADEISYASFKSRKLGNTNDRMTYSDEMALRNRQNCLDQWSWYDGCGCSYTEWMRSSPHSPHNRFNNFNRFGYGFGPSYGFYNYGNPYSAFGGYHPYVGYWGYNDFYMYPYHNNSFGITPYWYSGGFGGMYNPYGYGMGPYGYYGSGFGGYGYGGNSNGWGYGGGNSHSSSNVIRGPRGTAASGYYNPTGRTVPSNKVKSTTFTNTSPGRTPVRSASGRNVVVKEVSGRETIKNVPSSTNTGIISRDRIAPPNTGRPTGTTVPTRTNTGTPTRSGSSDYQRTYPSRTGAPSNSRTTGTVERSNSSVGGFERSSSSSTERSTISTPSRSSGGISSGSSSGGGRSGGSSGSSSSPGRR